MRFGNLLQRIDFSQAATVRMPVLGAKDGDQVILYSSDAESIYASDPSWHQEQIATVRMINKIPYVQFTTTHASRWAAVLNTDVDNDGIPNDVDNCPYVANP